MAIEMRLRANPDYYDYLHSMYFRSNSDDADAGEVELLDGGGQCLNFRARGRYVLCYDGAGGGRLLITGLMLMEGGQRAAALDDVDVRFVMERGPFRMTNGYSVVTAGRRYVFEHDPLAACMESRGGNLMFALEGDGPELGLRTYYVDVQLSRE
jgi:hypothetical protein